MRRPTNRPKRLRVHRWEGVVDEVVGDRFSACLLAVDHKGPEVWAEFEMEHLPDAAPGVVFNLYVYRRGRKSRTVLRRRNLGVWTEADLAALDVGGFWMGEP